MSSEIFSQIAEEIKSGNQDQALWTEAFAECDGDEPKTKALYIRLRAAQLKQQALPEDPKAHGAGEPVTGTSSSVTQPSEELRVLRAAIQHLLSKTGKTSFYSALGLTPTMSDSQVFNAISTLRMRAANGESLAPEVNYGIEAFADSVAREKYDRRLLNLLEGVATGDISNAKESPIDNLELASPFKGRVAGYSIGVGLLVAIGIAFTLMLPKTKKQPEPVAVTSPRNIKDPQAVRDEVQRAPAENQQQRQHADWQLQEQQAANQQRLQDADWQRQQQQVENQQRQQQQAENRQLQQDADWQRQQQQAANQQRQQAECEAARGEVAQVEQRAIQASRTDGTIGGMQAATIAMSQVRVELAVAQSRRKRACGG